MTNETIVLRVLLIRNDDGWENKAQSNAKLVAKHSNRCGSAHLVRGEPCSSQLSWDSQDEDLRHGHNGLTSEGDPPLVWSSAQHLSNSGQWSLRSHDIVLPSPRIRDMFQLSPATLPTSDPATVIFNLFLCFVFTDKCIFDLPSNILRTSVHFPIDI